MFKMLIRWFSGFFILCEVFGNFDWLKGKIKIILWNFSKIFLGRFNIRLGIYDKWIW